MISEIFRRINVCFIIDGCIRCNIICQFIGRINEKLIKKIKIVNCTYYQKYGIPDDPLILLYNKHFDGYPTTFKGTIRILGANTKIESYEQFKSLFEDEFLIPEQSEHKFIKDCEFKRHGLIKGVVCKD